MTAMATSRATATTSGVFWARRCSRRAVRRGCTGGRAMVAVSTAVSAPGCVPARPVRGSRMGLLPEGGADDVLGVDAGALELGGDRALAHHQHAVAEMADLGGVRGVGEDGAALAGELADERVELLLGAHVHAAGDVIEQEDLRVGQQPPA